MTPAPLTAGIALLLTAAVAFAAPPTLAAPGNLRIIQGAAPAPPPPGGSLETGQWKSIPGSEMDSVYNAAVDNQWLLRGKGWSGAWKNIQQAYSGATCYGNMLYVHGGGHNDSPHNGVLRLNTTTGVWTRLAEPSSLLWTEVGCAAGATCTMPQGGTCISERCGVTPDGKPTSRHTFSSIAANATHMYVVGGATFWTGTAGDPPRSFRFEFATGQWSIIPESPISDTMGAMEIVGDTLYYTSRQGKGWATLDIPTQVWTRTNVNISGFGGNQQMIYVEPQDRFYILIGGQASYVNRSAFGSAPINIPNPPAINDRNNLGLAYYPPDRKILIWKEGNTFTTLDIDTLQWGTATTGGESLGVGLPCGPPEDPSACVHRRLNYCGGRLILVNGVDKPMYYFDVGDSFDVGPVTDTNAATNTTNVGVSVGTTVGLTAFAQDLDPSNNLITYTLDSGAPMFAIDPTTGVVTVAGTLTAGTQQIVVRATGQDASFSTQAFDIIVNSQLLGPPISTAITDPVIQRAPDQAWFDAVCGPEVGWKVVEVGPGKAIFPTDFDIDAEIEAQISTTQSTLVKIWPAYVNGDPNQGVQPYAMGFRARQDSRCVRLEGQIDAQGRRPKINGSAAMRNPSGSTALQQKGLEVRNLHFNGSVLPYQGDCFFGATSMRYIALTNNIIEHCIGHGIITPPDANALIVLLVGNQWTYGSTSHSMYIDRAAFALFDGNTCYAAGWGHCLRSVARTSIIQNNIASNVELDGTPGMMWDNPARESIGMHPGEAYFCGEHTIRNNTWIYYQPASPIAAGTFVMRGRTDIRYCDLEGKSLDGTQWIKLDAADARFMDTSLWDTIAADLTANGTASRYSFEVLYGANRHLHYFHPANSAQRQQELSLPMESNSNWPSHDPIERQLMKPEMESILAAHPELAGNCEALEPFASPLLSWLLLHVNQASRTAVCANANFTLYLPRPGPVNWVDRNYIHWEPGNTNEICDASGCVPGGIIDLNMDDKTNVYAHPGDQLNRRIVDVNVPPYRIGFAHGDGE